MPSTKSNETDEIEKIMNEIEEIQQGLETPAPSTPALSVVEDHQMTIAGAEEDILREIQATAQTTEEPGSLEDMLNETSVFSDTETEEIMPHAPNGDDGTLSLTLTGNMTLKLKYEFEGQEVMISFVDQSLWVQMTDGTEFKIPVIKGGAAKHPSNVKPFKKVI